MRRPDWAAVERSAMAINGKEPSTLFLEAQQLSTTHRKGFCLLVRHRTSSQLGPHTIFTPCLLARVIPSTSEVPPLPSQSCSHEGPIQNPSSSSGSSYPGGDSTEELLTGDHSYCLRREILSPPRSGKCFLVTSVFSYIKTTKPAHGSYAMGECLLCLLMNEIY